MHSSARSPQKITPATTDRRPRRDWKEVTDVADALPPESQEGKEARAKLLNQGIVDSLTGEPSPLVHAKELPMRPRGRAKTQFGFDLVNVIKAAPKNDKNAKRGKKRNLESEVKAVNPKVQPMIEVEKKERRTKRDPLVDPIIKASEVKHRTGFASLLGMIAYIIIIRQ